ncbi:MAG: nucleotidyltransferase family protein [Paludibaculum sp.]
MSNVTAIVLAAGGASRMGRPKQLLDYGGQPLVRHAAETALASRCSEVVVVLGANSDQVQLALNGLPVTTVVNERWTEGMGTSIQEGLHVTQSKGADAVVLFLADQPLIGADFLDELIDIHAKSGHPIVAARYAGTVGVPVLFARQYFDGLDALRPQQGCKGLILAHAEEAHLVDCPQAEFDIDTPEDYNRLRAVPIV